MKRLAPGKLLRQGCRTGFVFGALVGAQEGFYALLLAQPNVGKVQLAAFHKLIQIFFTPVLIDALLLSLLTGLFALLLGWIPWSRLDGLLADETTFRPLLVGLTGGGALFIFLLLSRFPTLSMAFSLSPGKIFSQFRFLFMGLLAGMALATLVRWSRKRPVWPAVGTALLILALPATPVLFWYFRNLMTPDSRSAVTTAGAILLIALLVFLVIVLTRVLRRNLLRNRESGIYCRWCLLAATCVLAAGAILPLFLKSTTQKLDFTGYRAPKDMNVVLLTVDTLRADKLSCYDPGAPPTPNLDTLASTGVRFTNAQSQCPWTLPSLGSMMTAIHPSGQGLLKAAHRLDRHRVTIADALQDSGYLTQAVVCNGWLVETFGLSQGFIYYNHIWDDSFSDYWMNMIWLRMMRRFNPGFLRPPDSNDSAEMVDRALDLLDENGDNNFFLWIHVIDPHDPYAPLGRYRFQAGRDYEGRFARKTSGLVNYLRRGNLLNADDRRHLENLYDLEVQYTDEQMGRILDKLDELGLTDNTMVIFTSDHGEEFWDHENVGHGHTLFNELTHVPLIIRFPASVTPAGPVVKDQVRLIDIGPTILDVALDTVMEEAQGRTLMPLVMGDGEETTRLAFSEALIYFGEKKAVDDGRYRFIMSENSNREELYDFETDPGATVNLADTLPEVRLRLKEMLRSHIEEQEAHFNSLERDTEGNEAEIDAALEKKLKALGYMQ